MKLGFIGTGNISSDVITGICNSKISFKKITLSPRNKKKSRNLKKKFKKIYVAKTNQEVIDRSDWVFIGVLPEVGEKIQVLLRVVDADYQELEQFTLGIRIFYHEEQIDAVMPKMYQNGHIEMDYVFEMSGNHIFRVDLYDVSKDGQALTYIFNISAQNPFGYIFISAVTMGGIMTAIIFAYVYLSKRRSKPKQ